MFVINYEKKVRKYTNSFIFAVAFEKNIFLEVRSYLASRMSRD